MPPNLSSDKIVAHSARYTFGTWRFQKNWKPLHIVDAEGCWFQDASGKKYLDFSSQLVCSNLGHKNRAVIDAIKEQAEKLAYIAPAHTTDVRAELSALLLEVLPKGLTKFFFTTGGAEANEAAFKIARMVTGKTKIISRYRSYHGATLGAIAATGDFRRWATEPVTKIPGVIFAPEVNCYACPLGHEYPECGVACADYVEHMIRMEGDVAAVFVEPIVGTNGVLIPPDEYLPRLREMCDRHGVLLIVDEVMTGFGRSGTWFAVDHWDVKPDILVTAKGITAAYTPLGLCATTEKVASYFEDHFFSHGHTYEAHPLTLASAIAAIDEVRRLDLVKRSEEMGEYMAGQLRGLMEKHEIIGEVRGLGLFCAVELVQDRETKEPFNRGEDKVAGRPMFIDQVTAGLMKRGISVLGWLSHLVIAPPLIVSKEEIDTFVTALDEVLRSVKPAV